jgi:uncharacterized protein YjiK
MNRATSKVSSQTRKRKHHHPHRPTKSKKADWQEKDPSNITPIVKNALREAMQLEQISLVEYDDFLWIIAQESGGIVGVRNGKSTARGLFQLLRAQYGLNPNGERAFGIAVEECQGGIHYVIGRYRSAAAAKRFWQQHHWY